MHSQLEGYAEQEIQDARAATSAKKLSVYIPISDNGGGSGKTGWAVDMLSMVASGTLNGRTILFDELSGSHADRACNNMANRFLQPHKVNGEEVLLDVILIIDIDTRLKPRDIERVLSHIERGHQCVWGLYPKKQDDGLPCVNTWPTVEPADEFGLQEMRRAGRGFLAIRRDVFERLKEDNGGPAMRFHNHGRVEWSFFHSGVVTGGYSAILPGKDADGYPLREWITEDWMFCEDIRHYLGIPTLVDTGICLRHIGEKTYEFPAERLMRTDANIKSWRDIHGWFDYEDFYRWLVAQIPKGGKFVEVGCWMGKSIAAFAEFSKQFGNNVAMFVADTFDGKPDSNEQALILEACGGSVRSKFMANMEALGIEPYVIESKSTSASKVFQDGELDAVFIDAAHDYESVLADISAWYPKVKKDGILAGHDFNEPGVNKAVYDHGLKVEVMGRCWYLRKS